MKTKMPNLRKACRWRALLRLAVVAALVRLPLQLLGSTLDNGLIAWYPFTGNANDASTNGNNGTVMGAQLTTDRNGVPNQAYLFNGTTDYINVGQGVKPTFPLTITAWIYPFFFSSRRRHTRFDCDWSDVCSSDLRPAFVIWRRNFFNTDSNRSVSSRVTSMWPFQ